MTMSSSMPKDACSHTDLTMKLDFLRERARRSTIGVIAPLGHGPTQSGVGSPAALIRSFASTLCDVNEPPIAVEALDEVENDIGLEPFQRADGLLHVQVAGNLHRFVAEAPEGRRDRLELDENVELVGLGLLAYRIEENRNTHDRLTARSAPSAAPGARRRTGECGR
jgi:hypothetical protein